MFEYVCENAHEWVYMKGKDDPKDQEECPICKAKARKKIAHIADFVYTNP